MIKLPKGTRDYDGIDYKKLQYLINTATEVFETFQGKPVITPMFERRDVLTNKYGEEEKLIFNLEGYNDEEDESKDEKKELTSLRYDMTVPFVRYVIMNKITKMKRYSIGKVFRRENTSKKINRLREFYQADFDFVGEYDTNLPEIQSFKMINIFFEKLGVTNYKIKYNFRNLLSYYVIDKAKVDTEKFKSVCSSLDKLDKFDEDYVKNEMIETRGLSSDQVEIIFDCISKGEFPEEKQVTTINNNLLKMIEEYDIKNVVFDSTLARGLDYYTGIIFEIVIDGLSSSVGGGGRYDSLVSKYDRETNLPMMGFSFGLNRLLDFVNTEEKDKPTVLVMTIIQKTLEEDRKKLNKVKARVIDTVIKLGYAVDFMFNDKKARKQISKIASDSSYKYAIIIGIAELEKECVSIKNLVSREQKLVPMDDIEQYILPISKN